ncbi:MAG: helix-turn-helix transcriptional regulator, partial [Spirochaetaceae bacterium]|nr:helix-turn-helix transcriptional regulator [Spirochaetaceae bacterium]
MTEALFHSNIPVAPGAQVYLERPRIDQLLDKALASPVVSVSAGTGYGKSYAVYSFVKRRNVRTVWIQLSGRDNIGEHFWENFISAISSVNREVADSFSRMNFPVTDQQLERYRRIPQSKMAPGEKYIFVFDDLYLISEKAVLRFLEYSIARIFPGVTSIIISRTEPQLNLMRMESKGLLARITEDQLRFTQEEMVSYFYLLDVNPIPQIVDTVYKDTEGWAFAIHLAGLFFKNGEAERAGGYVPSAIRPNIFKLIESEVMAPLPEALQRFLVKLSLIERLAPELLDAIARTLDGGSGEDPGGEDAGSNLIAQMEAIGSYIRFDIYLNAYRIHHLFLDYLTGRQGSLSEQEKQDVWKKAAAWSEANNQKMDAITYYDKAGDYDGMVRLFYTLPQALPARMAQFVIDILDHSPPDIYRQYPINIVFRGRALISLGRLDQSREELLEALPTLEALPESHQKHRILLGCNINLGFMGLITAMYTKNYDFVNCFRRAFEESRLIGDYVYKPPINGCSLPAYACMVMDRQPLELEKALSFIREVIPYVASAIGGCMSGMYELARGEYAFFRGDFAAAEIYLQEGLRRGREHDQYEIENRALFYLLRIYLSRADTKIKEILKQLKAELEQPLFINRYAYYDIITAWYYIQTGEPERTAAWLKNDYEESGLGDLTKGLEKLVRAKYYLRAKRCPAA